MRALFMLTACACFMAHAQQYRQNFDSVTAPSLPIGWITTAARSASGDFTTTTSVPFSPPNAVVSTNAAVSQSLTSPTLDFTGKTADSLIFYERRSSSHNSGLILEASTDGGSSFPIQLADTLLNSGSTSYVRRAVALPRDLDNESSVNFRWRITGDGTGTTGTLRIDDITISAKADIDAAITGVSFSPSILNAGDETRMYVTVKNAGMMLIADIPVHFFEDRNNDSLIGQDELFYSTEIGADLRPGDTVQVSAPILALAGGVHRFIARLALPADQDTTNDYSTALLSVGLAKQSVVINEIMYEPASGYAEYVELYNRSSAPVDFKNWIISDVTDTSTKSKSHLITQSTLEIGAGDYLVVASDSTIYHQFPYLYDTRYHVVVKHLISLNNTGDAVILGDFTRATIDSLHYFPSWHNADVDETAGRSLERINPDLPGTDNRNWSTCADPAGGTPGKANSLYTKTKASGASISFAPNPFSPDGDGFEDATIMNYELPSSTGIIRVRIYDSIGRLVRILADGEPAGPHGSIIWDGYDDRRNRVRMGIYIVLLEALDAGGGEVQTVKGVVVVAVKL